MLASFPKVPKTYSVQNPWKSTFLITPLSFDAPSPENPCEYPHKPYVAQKLESMAYIFAADSMGLSSFIFVVGSKRRIFYGTECVSAIQGHPRSWILAPIERAYVTSY